MLTSQQKANILIRTGAAVPAFPVRDVSALPGPMPAMGDAQKAGCSQDVDHEAVVRRWEQNIDTLYVDYVAARAARSLREAEEASQMHRLRAANARDSQPRHSVRAAAR